MSWASKFIFDPVVAALARLAGSSNPPTAAAGQAALAAASKLGADAASGLVAAATAAGTGSSYSPAALGSKLLQDLEDGLNGSVEAYVTAAVPIVGPELGLVAANTMALAEQHALTYVSALFQHHQATYAAAVVAAQGTPTIPNGGAAQTVAGSLNMKAAAASTGAG